MRVDGTEPRPPRGVAPVIPLRQTPDVPVGLPGREPGRSRRSPLLDTE
jgi:hypothetical protein